MYKFCRIWRWLSLVYFKQVVSEREFSKPVWFVSWQHAGHIKALCPIAAELQRRGREVKFVVHEEVLSLVPSQLPALSAGPLPWTWDEELQFRQALWDPAPPPAEAQSATRKGELSERYFFGSQHSLLQGLNQTLHRLPKEQWPGLLAIDVSSVGAMDLAEKLSLRFAVVSSWPVGPTLQSVEPSAGTFCWLPSELFAFTQTIDQQSFADRLKRYLFGWIIPLFMSWAGFHEPRQELRRSIGLGRLELLEAPQTAANGGHPLLCILSHWGLDRPRPLPPRALLVGSVEDYSAKAIDAPLLTRPVQDWLGSATQIVYISFGTNVRPRQQVFQAILASASRMKDVRFLWDTSEEEVQAVLSDGDAHAMALPENVLAARVPQISVLSSGRIEAFVTHCGFNSVHEALHFGVPMLGLPFVGDQMVTARLLTEIGAGLRLSVPALEEQQVAEALQQLLADKAFARRAAHAGRIGSHAGGARAAADALETALLGVEHLQMLVDKNPQAARLWDVQLALALPALLMLGYLAKALRLAPPGDPEAGAELAELADPAPAKPTVTKATRKKRS
ncbi:unnamed protein product [Effrenium voratum]|nr:unnamed protein product [Effrenium voratum]